MLVSHHSCSLDQLLVELERATDHRRMLLNADSDAVGLGWGWRFCIVESLPGVADSAHPLTTLCGRVVDITTRKSVTDVPPAASCSSEHKFARLGNPTLSHVEGGKPSGCAWGKVRCYS